MKRIINFIIFFVSIWSFAQAPNHSYDFKFYKYGSFRNSKKMTFQLVKDIDTINCEVSKGKIQVPNISGKYTVVVTLKKDKYVVENVDFSKLYLGSTIVFGIENDFSNFSPPASNQYPTIYTLPNSLIPIKIEHIEQARSVHFVVFTSEKQDGKKLKEVRSYSQYFIVK